MTAVLVTGASTPIGESVIQAILDDSPTSVVVGVGLEQPTYDSLPAERYVPLAADLTRHRDLRSVLYGPAREHAVRSVIHLAQHRNANDSGANLRRLHVTATRELLRLAESHPSIEHVIIWSHAHVYDVSAANPTLVSEDHPLRLNPGDPQWLRDRVEADLSACVRMGMSDLRVVVLRCAECLHRDIGSQLYDYLQSRVSFRPLGFDPMLNLLSLGDLTQALVLALGHARSGIFNIPGADTLPLSAAIQRFGQRALPLPGPLLGPLYHLRSLGGRRAFRYDLNHWRFHFSCVLSGIRAEKHLGYVPKHPLEQQRSKSP